MSNIAALIPPPSVETRMNALVPSNIEQAIRLAEVMSQANLVPDHLRGKPGDCLLVVMQSQRWGMDAVSVAQCTSVVRGKLCYEGKLVAAVLYAMGSIEGRLRYEFIGTDGSRGIRVIGRPRGETKDQIVEGTVAGWKTCNDAWQRSPDDMLVYRGTRQWARRYAPEALLGVYTPDELEEAPPMQAVPQASSSRDPAPYPDESIERNLSSWQSLIASGRKTADDIIAMIASKATLTDQQRQRIRALTPIEGEAQEVQP